MKKLTIELVPQTSFFKNLRSMLTAQQWDVIRKNCYAKANHKCEICGVESKRLDCHEVWEYTHGIQKLVGLVALCPSCHEVKHMGLAQIRGRQGDAMWHMMNVNEYGVEECQEDVDKAFELWQERSCREWKIDTSLLEELTK